ncbi:MAG: type VII toxin-antitoxin system MntA family adenylyltransferase antitoxin [Bacillota bacterium]
MLDKETRSLLAEIFSSYPEIIAVYLFGSCLEKKECARDMDLAVLLKQPVKSQVDIYMRLYPHLAQSLAPMEPDLLFLHSASLPVRFEAVSTGEVIYSRDDERRTDFEYIVSGEYMDFKYHLDMARRELFEAIKEDSYIV